MRDWTKTLLPASFKGFSFQVETEGNDGGGRRVVTHEYVRGETHDTEDMGRKTQSFTVKAYLASDGADAESSAFMSLLSSKGPGVLVLPVHGAHLVNCTEVKSSSEKTKLGYVAFELKFVPANAIGGGLGASLPAFANMAFTAAGTLASMIGPSLMDALSGQSIPSRAGIARAGEILTSAAAITGSLVNLAPVPRGETPVDFDIRLVRSSIARATSLVDIADQVDVVTGFIHAHAGIADSADMQAACIGLALSMSGAVPKTASLAIANEQRIGKRITQSIALLMVAEAGAAAAARTFTSRVQAKASREAIVAAFDVASEQASDVTENVMSAASASIASSVRHIDETSGDLAPLVQIDLARALPSTAIAWALYRDPSRAPELVAAARTGTSLLMPTSFVAPAR